jgi:hypothetical protein
MAPGQTVFRFTVLDSVSSAGPRGFACHAWLTAGTVTDLIHEGRRMISNGTLLCPDDGRWFSSAAEAKVAMAEAIEARAADLLAQAKTIRKEADLDIAREQKEVA